MSNLPFPEISDEALRIGFRKAIEFRNLLILASVILAIVSLLFGLDFLLGSLLGSAIVGLNFHWTVRFALNMLEERKFGPRLFRMLMEELTKYIMQRYIVC